MIILNVGCGGVRPGSPFINLDQLHGTLLPGTPERENLDRESNYVNADILQPLPFPDEHFDACCAIHVAEHLDCHQAVRFLTDCHRILKPDGLLVVSVPDADYFLSVHDKDTPENAVVLFGEPIHDKWQPNFMSYALFHRDHRQVLTGGSLRCLLIQAGFKTIWRFGYAQPGQSSELKEIEKIMNRRQFSLEMCAIKSSAP